MSYEGFKVDGVAVVDGMAHVTMRHEDGTSFTLVLGPKAIVQLASEQVAKNQQAREPDFVRDLLDVAAARKPKGKAN